MSYTDIIYELRGGHPAQCDFCGQEYNEHRYPVAEEADQWACNECLERWEKQDLEAELEEKKQNILAGEQVVNDDDKGYQIGTQEAYDEFVKKRNGG